MNTQTRFLRRSPLHGLLLVLLTVPLLPGVSCPPPPPPPPKPGPVPPAVNTPPTADAGSNQTVAENTTVVLDGTASSDPDGDLLTYAWTQIGGANAVVLSNAFGVVTTFVAPGTVDTLQFELTVDDGQGGTDSAAVTVAVGTVVAPPLPPVQPPTLYIANFNGFNVTAYDITDPQAINANAPPHANLAGAQTLLNRPTDILIDAGGALLVSNFSTPSITGYDSAADLTGINGNFAPSRNVEGAATLLNMPTTLAVNPAADLVFVADLATDDVFVYGNASTTVFNGNLPPIRTIMSVDLSNPFGINFGAGDDLYVANNLANNVVVFANASNLNGAVTATRIITSAAFNNLFDVFVDRADNMFVVESAPGNQIHVFHNASIRTGMIAPDVTLTVPGAGILTAIAVDAAGNGYIVDFTNNAVYGYDNIATRNGTFTPDRTLQGANTQLDGPIRVFLLE